MVVLAVGSGAQNTVQKKPAPKTATAPVATKAPAAATKTATKSAPVAHSATASHTATAARTGTGVSTAAARRRRATGTQAHRTNGPAPIRRTWRNRQAVPTPERYKEIQEALVTKGYLTPDAATGTWGPASIDAMKRFQTAQNIEATGKLNSLSLIALGLGPKHDTASVVHPPAPPAASQDPNPPGAR